MLDQQQIAPAGVAGEPSPAPWRPATRLAFRFCFVYLGLYCLTTQVIAGFCPIPNVDIPDPASFKPFRIALFWVAAHVFHASTPLVYTGSGSGDKTFDWVLAFCLLVLAVFATAAWSILDRKRDNYLTLHKWFHLFLRFAVGAMMISYGIAKVIPTQMPYPFLSKLVEPFGQFSPMGILWYSIGAAPGYEVFVGAAELVGGALLFLPRTTTFGAMVCLADAIEVFLLNMTYDVPVKLFSFHLIAMCLVLLAPEFPRIARFFFSDHVVGPSEQPLLFQSRRANRTALAVQAAFGLVLVGMNFWGSWSNWYHFGGGMPRPPLHGIWNVDQLTIDGQARPPLLTDTNRWRRVLVETGPRIVFQRLDDSLVTYGGSIDTNKSSIELNKFSDKAWNATFQFQRSSHKQLTLDGLMDGQKVHMELSFYDRTNLLLVRRGFHWIQEYPFNK
jgi:hypothetical protein